MKDLYVVSQYIKAKLTDSDLLSNVPHLEAPTADEIQAGHRLFQEKGCASCHAVGGASPQKEFGPDLSALGGKNASESEFGKAIISHILAPIFTPN